MKKRRKRWFILAGVIIIVLLLVVFNLRREEKAVSVQTSKVKRGEVVSKISAPGEVKPVTQIKISANIMGKITRLPVKEGDEVKKGQLLVEIDPAPFRAQVEQYQAALELAKAQLTQTQSLLKRKRELFSLGLSSAEELEQLETQVAVNEAQVARDEAALRQAREELAKTTIVSPITGVITQLNVELGEVVVTGTMNNPGSVIMTVADLSKMEVEAKVDENDIRDVRENQSVEVSVDALPDTILEGKVSEVGYAAIVPELTASEQTPDFLAKVDILNPPPSLRPGMSSTVKIKTAAHKDVLTVPIQAVVMRDVRKEMAMSEVKDRKGEKKAPKEKGDQKSKEEEAIYIVSSRTAKVRAVKTGISGDTEIEVLSGLKEGEEVVSGPFRALKTIRDGLKVKVGKGPGTPENEKK